MVFEYMDHDLAGILTHPKFTFRPAHIKELLRQMLEGLHYLHHRGILHRDIKGSNILLDADGQLKLADFGLARLYHKHRANLDYTNRVITLWYRPPELLLGATAYGPAVDIWSIGCIMLEMVTKKAIFPGHDEIDQLVRIWDIMGSPTSETWPKVTELPWWELVKPQTIKPERFRDDYAEYYPFKNWLLTIVF
jgi:CTD kinase subunit alpha